MRNRTIALALLLPVCTAGAAAVGQSTAAARTGLSITLYSDQALVRDMRRVTLAAGRQRLELRDVAATLQPETVSFGANPASGLVLLEQDFEFDPLTPASLLRKYVGRPVTVIHTNPATGAETSESATVLSDDEGVVLRFHDRIETGVPGRLAFGDVPADLHDRPLLSVLLEASQAGERQVEVTYLAGGVGWKADYTAMLDADGTRMTLNGWATLTNQSGIAYPDVKLQLVAGTVHRTATVHPLAAAAPMSRMLMASELPEEQGLGDYHLFTVPHPVTLENRQIKQVALLSASDVPVRREYVLQNDQGSWWYDARRSDAQKNLKPGVYLRFENRGGELGVPLPAGVVRAYMADRQGAVQWIGEDRMGHIARGEAVSLRLGDAFDLTADRVQTDYQALSKRSSQSSFRIELRNAGARPATVVVREPLRGDWKITAETASHIKEGTGWAAWSIPVPADGTAVLEYTAVHNW